METAEKLGQGEIGDCLARGRMAAASGVLAAHGSGI
jgi:hypothetical protein